VTRIAPIAASVLLACAGTSPGPAPAPAEPAASTIEWRAGPAIPSPRDHHVTFLVPARAGGGWLHVAGGNDYRTVFRDAWRVRVEPDGRLSGSWEPAGELPARRAGSSVVTDGRTVVVVGGQDSSLAKRAEAWAARIGDDGSLGSWVAVPSLPAPRFHHAATLRAGWIYVTGGLEGRTSVDGVFRARLDRDGTVGPWEALAPMPRPRSHHGAFAHDGALWLVAGLDGNPAGENVPLADVIRARFLPDGRLGPWETVSTLPHAYGTHAAFAAGGSAWLVGGVEDNARFVDVVLRAPFEGAGLGTWSATTPGLPKARSHVHQLPRYGAFVYSVSGSNRRQVLPDVWMGELRTP